MDTFEQTEIFSIEMKLFKRVTLLYYFFRIGAFHYRPKRKRGEKKKYETSLLILIVS